MLASFRDELEKIAAVSISGLSPATVLNAPQPGPMPTPGYEKAKAILDIADGVQQTKVAAKKKPKPIMEGYALPTAAPTSSPYGAAKQVLTHGLAGAGGGRLASELIGGARGASSKAKFVGTAAGAAVGLGDLAYQKIRSARAAKQMPKVAFAPGMALKASKQVGTVSRSLNQGMGKMKGVPTIGQKGRLP